MENQIKKLIEKFDSFDYYLDKKLDRDIEENRKGQFVIRITDADGNPVKDAKVKVKQTSHEFNFGCTVFYLDQFDDEERNKIYRKKFTDIFNYAVIPFYWDTLEPEEGKPRFDENSKKISRRPPIDTAVKFCKENSLRMKGHCLIYNSFQPDWLPNNSRDIKIKIDNRLKAIAKRYQNDFEDFDVINEMYTIYKNCYKGNGERNLLITDERDHEKWSFDICKKYFPHSRLFWNEGTDETFKDYKGHRSFYYMTLKEQLQKGTPIEGIGMQFHAYPDKEIIYDVSNVVFNPLRVIDVFDCYGEFGLPIHISEISIPSYDNTPENELLQAEILKRMYKLWFGRKNCNSIVWWNFADGTAYKDENRLHAGLLRNDCSSKPAYEVLDKLINHEWNTSFESTLASDYLKFSGFYGNYEIEITKDNKTTVHNVRLFKENTGYDNRLCDFRKIDIII